MKRKKYRSISKASTKNNDNKNYIIIFIAIIIMFVLGYIFIKLAVDFKENIQPIYSYTVQKNSDYEVLLKPNNFYKTEILPSGNYYASQSIDLFKVNFEYNFKSEKRSNISYNYDITANLIGTVKNNDNQDKEIWNRTFSLIGNNKFELDNVNAFLIRKDININYQYYNELVRAYEIEYGINIDATLRLRLNVSCNTNIETKDIENDDYIELEIPITNTITEARENYEKNLSKEIEPEIKKFNVNRIIYFIIGGLFIISAISVGIISIIIRKNKLTPEDKYIQNIKHILKYYGDIIVTVNNSPDLSNLKVMDITTLDDLIDVAEQSQRNIIKYEVIEKQKSNMYVIVDEYVYIYVVTSAKLK